MLSKWPSHFHHCTRINRENVNYVQCGRFCLSLPITDQHGFTFILQPRGYTETLILLLHQGSAPRAQLPDQSISSSKVRRRCWTYRRPPGTPITQGHGRLSRPSSAAPFSVTLQRARPPRQAYHHPHRQLQQPTPTFVRAADHPHGYFIGHVPEGGDWHCF